MVGLVLLTLSRPCVRCVTGPKYLGLSLERRVLSTCPIWLWSPSISPGDSQTPTQIFSSFSSFLNKILFVTETEHVYKQGEWQAEGQGEAGSLLSK